MESNEGRVLSSLELPPLASEPTVAKIGLAGGACALVAGLMGLVDISAAANETLIPARVILSALGMLIAGSALTLRLCIIVNNTLTVSMITYFTISCMYNMSQVNYLLYYKLTIRAVLAVVIHKAY